MSGPPRKTKKPTATTKAHRFEGFTNRIAKIKIDPVHTIQKTRVAECHNDLSQSFFRSALDEWAELNPSATFTSFLNKAQPLSESLPQLLHHADEVLALLHEHIKKEDVLALEPLLSLVAHLAHDLGLAFEKHFSSTVKLVAEVSARVDDPEAIENCFTCLAWMFKYLSRLLLQDLRPLLEIMVPYFSSRKEHIRRFSAESLAFLLRKTVMMYNKKAAPLQNAILYLFGQLEAQSDPESMSYEKALMALLSETATGVDAQLHSCAVDLFKCLFETVRSNDKRNSKSLPVLNGTIVHIIHRTDAAGFRPLLQLITDIAVENRQDIAACNQMSVGLLFDVTATRKGSRISEWEGTLLALLNQFQQQMDTEIPNRELLSKLVTIAAIVLQYCPMNQLLPFVKEILDKAISVSSPYQFFAFCEVVANLGKQRFQDLLLPRLQQYIISHWTTSEAGLCYLFQRLRKENASSTRPNDPGYLACPKKWETDIVARLETLDLTAGLPMQHARCFQLHDTIHFPKDNSVRKSIQSVLETHLNHALAHQSADFDLPNRLSVGWAFEFYLSLFKEIPQSRLNSLVVQVFQCRPEYYQLVPFLESCLQILSQAEQNTSRDLEIQPVITVLCENMLSESFDLKLKSIEVLHALGRVKNESWLSRTASLLLEIARIPYLPSNARELAMLIRRLPKQQEACDETNTLRNLVPLFAIGLLRHYYDQTRKEVCIALGQMAAAGKTEDLILEVAIPWLQRQGVLTQPSKSRVEDEKPQKLSPFECSNHQAVQNLSLDAFERHSAAEQNLYQEFEQQHLLRPATVPSESRVLALQLFMEIPEIAERRSRSLVPVFLSVQQNMANHLVLRSDESTSSHTISPDFNDQPWSLKERRLFLDLICKFVNPRVLYRSRELYDYLLELLTNGNTDIRKPALLALLNWKDPSLPQYKDALLSVAEEKNANTELALLLADDEETGSIKSQDRQYVLPMLLRLVFGQIVGRAGTHGSQEAKRNSILRLLFRMEEKDINLFLKIALGRLGEVSISSQLTPPNSVLDRDIVSQDQQYGFLRMMLSIQEILQNQYAPYGKVVVDAILYCTARACRQTKYILKDNSTNSSVSALTRNIRRSGIQCLTTIFEHCDDINWDQYLSVIFEEIVNPRVANLAAELTQGVSGLLRMFSAWSRSLRLAYLLQHNSHLTANLWTILAVTSARDDVKVYLLEHLLVPLLDLSGDTVDIKPNAAVEILRSNVEVLLQSLVHLLQRQPPKDLLLAITKVIPPMAPFAVSLDSANEVLNLFVTLLCEPAQRIPPHVKGQLLSATESLVKIQQEKIAPEVRSRLYNVVAGLFNYFKDQPNRAVLGELLSTLSAGNSDLQQTVRICQNLNAVSNKHLGEIDYEKRLDAYHVTSSFPIANATSQQWLPILNNLLFFVRTAEDFAIRSNAVASLKYYILEACNSQNPDLQDLVEDLLLPAFQKGVKEASELVRNDFVIMYGLVVKHLPNAPHLEDMKILLVDDNEEASFFTNILHIQQHRRVRAIRRLLTEVERGVIKSANIVGFFLPLLEKFIDDEGSDESAQGVKGQSIAATPKLLRWTNWKSFRTIFRQYRSDLDTASRSEKEAIKLLGNAADALTSAMTSHAGNDSDMDTIIMGHLKSTLPTKEIIEKELKENFIPKLSKFIHHKDEAEISLRIPAAKVAVKLIKLLSPKEIPLLVAPIILDVSQILRSRAQESRDVARNTLAEIVVLLGSSSIQFILKQMRTTLTRGYQLHVLSYTLHTILLQSAETRVVGDLDYCLEDLVTVIVDDIFGVVGQEKENQDYISGMKEVKSSKSQDSMEILAKSASIRHMSKLVHPFQSLLTGNLTNKQVRHVDELFRRIGVGISHNPSASSRDLLVFAYELIQAFYREKNGIQERILTNEEKNKQRFLIQTKSASETTSSTSSSLQYKIVRFALDIVRSTFAKHASLLTAENAHGFLPIVGDALVEAQEDVRISAFRLLSTIIKLPLSELDKNVSLYVIEAVKVVKSSINMSEESPQAALKLVTAILRDRKNAKVRDSDIAYLLHRTMPDIEEPDRQGVTFNFIKAVMARQYQLPEVYELMDKVGIMMVTNQTRSAREVARGVFVHFLLEYPQSKTRWAKQLRFLMKNLEYEFREGRQSVMEAVHVLLQKLEGGSLQEVVSTFFIPVVLRMANDDDQGCREMARALLAQLFRATDQSQLSSLLGPLRVWLEQTDNPALAKVSLQAWSIYFESISNSTESEVPAVRKTLTRILQVNDADEPDWEMVYHALELYSKLTLVHPTLTMTQSQGNVWAAVRQLLVSPQSWIQESATNLVGVFLQDCISSGKALELPMTSQYGLRFDAKAIRGLLRDSLRIIKRNEGSMDLAQKTVQNLGLLATYAEATGLDYEVKAALSTINSIPEKLTEESEPEHDTEDDSDSEEIPTKSIPGTQYLLDQLTLILRREPKRLTTTAFTPKLSALNLLETLISQLSVTSLSSATLTALLVSLTHITDPSLQAPRSADPTFAATYQSYIESSQNLQEAIQRKVGDAVYIKLMTEASKIVRERRGERKMKRAIDRVAEPERAEREKMRRKEMKANRKRSVVGIYRGKRRADFGV